MGGLKGEHHGWKPWELGAPTARPPLLVGRMKPFLDCDNLSTHSVYIHDKVFNCFLLLLLSSLLCCFFCAFSTVCVGFIRRGHILPDHVPAWTSIGGGIIGTG